VGAVRLLAALPVGGAQPSWTTAAAGLAIPYLAAAVFILLWPWMWFDSLANDWSHLSDYVRFVIDRGRNGRETWTVYPFVCFALTTPLFVLGSGAIGLAVGWRGDRPRRAIWLLLVIWMILPLLRIAAPHSNFYDANRHFIEYVPALCCLAGVGFWMTLGAVGRLAARLAARRRLDPARTGALTLAATLAMAGLGVVGVVSPVVASHPWETAYFNRLVGGLGGAQRRHPLYQPPPHDPWGGRQRVRLLVELAAQGHGHDPEALRNQTDRGGWHLRKYRSARAIELDLFAAGAGHLGLDRRLERRRPRDRRRRLHLRHAARVLLLAGPHPRARSAAFAAVPRKPLRRPHLRNSRPDQAVSRGGASIAAQERR
jgi:hypothetical protein